MAFRAALAMLCIAMFACSAAQAQEALTLTPANPVPRAQFGTEVNGKLTGAFGMSAQTAMLGPCVMRTLHTHSLTELLYVFEGSIDSYQIREDNTIAKVTLVAGRGNVTQPQAVVYPAGRQHLQYNPNCKPAFFLAAFPGAGTTPAGTPVVTTTNIPAANTPAVLPADIRRINSVGPVPQPFSLADSRFPFARPFTPAASGVFAFYANAADQLNGACLRRCRRVVPLVSG